MTEEEFEAKKFWLQPHVDAVDLTPDFVFFDEKGPNTKVFKPAIEEREIQAKALGSRTPS